jgi:hypothetical protein
MAERFGEYELLKKIATGGMAEIHLARIGGVEGFSRRVVVKRMLPQLAVRQDFVQMFLDEARLAANLVHPNIVQVFNLGEVDGAYFMAMELVDGPHLGALFAHSLRQRRPLPVELCVFIVARGADGLHYAHDQRDPATGQKLNIVHRDISPQNVLVSKHGDVKVTDFGVAKAETQQAKTRTGIIKGKVSYMSPEQCLGDPVDRRTDVFALGIVLYELLTRRRLFREKSDLLVMQRITSEDLKPPSAINPAVDPELDRITLKALGRDVNDRFQSAADLSEALDIWLATQGHADSRSQLQRWMEAHADGLGIGHVDAEVAEGTPAWEKSQQEDAAPGVEIPEMDEGTVSTPALDPALEPTFPSEDGHPVISADGSGTEVSETTVMAEHELPGRSDTQVVAPDQLVSPSPQPGPPTQEVAPVQGSLEELQLPPVTSGGRSGRTPMAAVLGVFAALLVAGVGGWLALGPSADPPEDPGPKKYVEGPPPEQDPPPVGEDPQPPDAVPSKPPPDEDPAPKAETRKLTVRTVPPGVLITVDGEAKGNAPQEGIEVPAATAAVTVRAHFEGQPPLEKTVAMDGDVTEVELKARAQLNVRSEPPGAELVIDGEGAGATPREQLWLEGGEVVIAVSKAGYEPWTQKVALEPGKVSEVTAKLKQAQAAPKPKPTPRVRQPARRTEYGELLVDSKPWGNVYVDGRRVGATPVRVPRVAAGGRKIRVENRELGFKKTVTVDVKKKAKTRVGFVFTKQGDRYVFKKVVK